MTAIRQKWGLKNVKLGANGNIIWQQYYGVKQRDIETLNIKELMNKDLIVCGVQRIYYTPTVSQPIGFLMRTDSLGNLKWRNNYIATNPIRDTIADCYLYDIIELPDKSIAAVGQAFGSGYFSTIQQSWLLRVDSMGCLVPGCAPMITNAGEEVKDDVKISAYPNPFKNELNVIYSFRDVELSAVFQLIETGTGRIVQQKTITDPSGYIQFNTENLASGLYMLCIKQSSKPTIYFKVVNMK